MMSATNIIATGSTLAAGNFGSPIQLIMLLVIVVLLFGGNRLRNLGGDLGGAIKGFKKAMREGEEKDEDDLPKLMDANVKLEKVINPTVDSEVASKPKVIADKVAKPRAVKPKETVEKTTKPRAKPKAANKEQE